MGDLEESSVGVLAAVLGGALIVMVAFVIGARLVRSHRNTSDKYDAAVNKVFGVVSVAPLGLGK